MSDWPEYPPWLTTVFRCEVGSRALGVVTGADDRDEMGIAVPTKAHVMGLARFEQYVWRSQPEGVRSGPGDLDLTIYAARKWMSLALNGNPTVLLPLFVAADGVRETCPEMEALRRDSSWLLGRHVAKRFLGYMTSQREQMLGLRGKKHTNRPELIDLYGFDVKFAYHMVRLGWQSVELLTTGRMQLPMIAEQRDWLLELRAGRISMTECLDAATQAEAQLLALSASADLPERADSARADVWLVDLHERVWAGV